MADDKTTINKDWNEEALKKYAGFEIHPYDAYQITPFALVFITRPKLFIKSSSSSTSVLDQIAYSNMANHPYLSRFIDKNIQNNKDKILVDLLSYSTSDENRGEINHISFIPIFTNRIKNFSLESNQIQTAEQGTTKHGYRHIYPTTNIPSLSSGVLSLDIPEMQDSEIGNLVGIWYNTIVGMVSGELRANPDLIKNNRIDYNSSLYYFKLDRDARTIRYWAKYNGVFPVNNPTDAFSWQEASVNLSRMNISLSFDSREELTLSILDDFNNTSLNRLNTIDNASTELDISTFSKENIFLKADDLVDRVPLIYVEEFKDTVKTKKRFVLKLGSDSVYKSASQELFDNISKSLSEDYGIPDRSDTAGAMGSRKALYGQKDGE